MPAESWRKEQLAKFGEILQAKACRHQNQFHLSVQMLLLSWVMMCYLKMSKLGRKRQEPSSRSKISLCCQDCNNSCKAVKNLLWHWRDESADTEVIGWSRWLLLQISGEQNLPGVCPSGSSSPWTFLFWGLEWGEGSSSPLNTTIHDEVSELKSKYFHWQKFSSKGNHLS